MKTPNMARLAKAGTSFENCCSTSPICVPHRAMLITGQWPHQSGYVSNHSYGDGKSIGITSPTIAHAFRDGGYKTGYIGKWHLMNETCQNAGFDFFEHWLYGDDHWDTQVRNVTAGEDFHSEKEYNAIGMTDNALKFIDQHAGKEEPFFLMLSLNPPHWRWDDAPEEFLAMYPEDEMTFRPNVTEKYRKGIEKNYFRHYQAHISAVDQELGRLMDALKEKGLEEDTILVYTSDHGSSFGSNDVSSKANPFDESIRVPFIVQWPNHIPADRSLDQNVGTMDLLPTLCGLAGITPSTHYEGLDFSPVLFGKPGPDPESQFITVNNFPRNYFLEEVTGEHANYFCPFRGVRTKQYSYVVNAAGEWFLYDNKADPYQMKNLVDDPGYAEVKDQLRQELGGWLAKAEDPYLPEELRNLSVPERIAKQNQYYTLLIHQEEWDQYVADAVAPYAEGATSTQKKQIHRIANQVFNADFYGHYAALDSELNSRRLSDRPLDEVEKELVEYEKKHANQLRVEIANMAS